MECIAFVSRRVCRYYQAIWFMSNLLVKIILWDCSIKRGRMNYKDPMLHA